MRGRSRNYRSNKRRSKSRRSSKRRSTIRYRSTDGEYIWVSLDPDTCEVWHYLVAASAQLEREYQIWLEKGAFEMHDFAFTDFLINPNARARFYTDGRKAQTTPGTDSSRYGSKEAGYRSIARISVYETQIPIWKTQRGEWRIGISLDPDIQKGRAQVPASRERETRTWNRGDWDSDTNDSLVVWMWRTSEGRSDSLYDLSRFDDWYPYTEMDNEMLEKAFRDGKLSNVQVANEYVMRVVPNMYPISFFQVRIEDKALDLDDARARPARRVQMTSTQMRKAFKHDISPDPGDAAGDKADDEATKVLVDSLDRDNIAYAKERIGGHFIHLKKFSRFIEWLDKLGAQEEGPKGTFTSRMQRLFHPEKSPVPENVQFTEFLRRIHAKIGTASV